MFVCRLDSDFGVGYTPLEAFDDMMNLIIINQGLDATEGIDPADCEFFENIEVSISKKTIWDIQPVYEFEVDE